MNINKLAFSLLIVSSLFYASGYSVPNAQHGPALDHNPPSPRSTHNTPLLKPPEKKLDTQHPHDDKKPEVEKKANE